MPCSCHAPQLALAMLLPWTRPTSIMGQPVAPGSYNSVCAKDFAQLELSGGPLFRPRLDRPLRSRVRARQEAARTNAGQRCTQAGRAASLHQAGKAASLHQTGRGGGPTCNTVPAEEPACTEPAGLKPAGGPTCNTVPGEEPACAKAAEEPACTKPAEAEEPVCTKPAVLEECAAAQEPQVARGVVHRICLSGFDFDGTARRSLLSWSYGYRQFLWTYGSAVGARLPPGGEVRNAALLLAEAEYKELMGKGAAIDYVHNLLVVRALLACGGVYVAMDVLWLGRQLPVCSKQMWIAPRDVARLQGTHAQAWAAARWSMARVGSAADWTNLLQMLECYFYSLAAVPARASQVKFASKVHPRDVALPVMLCCPLAKSAVLPVNFDELEHTSFAVTVWADTWPVSLLEAVLTWATSCLSFRHATHPTAFPMRDSEEQYLTRTGIVKRLQELLPIVAQLCDDMHAAYRIVADAIAYAQTKGGMDIVALGRLRQPPLLPGRLHQPALQAPVHVHGDTTMVDELAVVILIVFIPKYISDPPLASWRDVLVQQGKVATTAVNSLVPVVRAKILGAACLVPAVESADKQWGIPTAVCAQDAPMGQPWTG